ncbi:MAG: hypothetical protein AAGF50_03320, partial [Pseudomonadota bacterium]
MKLVSSFGKGLGALTVAALVLGLTPPATAQTAATVSDYILQEFGAPPDIPTGPLSQDLDMALTSAFVDSIEQSVWGEKQTLALLAIAESGDPRLVWPISDLLRFTANTELTAFLTSAASELLGKRVPVSNAWGTVTDHLIAWDVPAPPDYLRVKRAIFTGLIPGWEKIFVEGDIDWRLVSWGGVLIDARAYDTTDEA